MYHFFYLRITPLQSVSLNADLYITLCVNLLDEVCCDVCRLATKQAFSKSRTDSVTPNVTDITAAACCSECCCRSDSAPLCVCLCIIAGHDCSIRLWNLDSKTCVQEITSHRKKFDESIHDVAFHPSKPFIASAGADALAKVFAWCWHCCHGIYQLVWLLMSVNDSHRTTAHTHTHTWCILAALWVRQLMLCYTVCSAVFLSFHSCAVIVLPHAAAVCLIMYLFISAEPSRLYLKVCSCMQLIGHWHSTACTLVVWCATNIAISGDIV